MKTENTDRITDNIDSWRAKASPLFRCREMPEGINATQDAQKDHDLVAFPAFCLLACASLTILIPAGMFVYAIIENFTR